MKRGHMRLSWFANLPVFIEHKNTWIGCIHMQVVLDASFFRTGDGADSFDFSAFKNFFVWLGDSPWGAVTRRCLTEKEAGAAPRDQGSGG